MILCIPAAVIGEGKSMLAVLKLELTVLANFIPDVGPASFLCMA